MRTKKITVAEVEYAAFTFARRLMTWNEPIPDFGTRFPNILESCLATPFGQFNRKHLYRGLIEKGSILFYLLIKNHPFQNGNKRIAVTTLLVFLHRNRKWLNATRENLYKFAVEIAKSNSKLKDKYILIINKFI